MTTLKIADNLSLPFDIVTDTIGILAIRGSGKTYTFLCLGEQMVKHNLPVVMLDTMGVCWGIRSSADGKSPGLPVTILGGSHGDVPLESQAGRVIADWIVSDRQPTVLDISEFSKAEGMRFVLDFVTRLFQVNRQPLHLMIDEADAWAPQRPFREEARTLSAMEVLVRRGRARGIGVTLVTQRPATLNKDVLTQMGMLIVGRMIAPQDRKAVQAWIDAHGTERQKEEFWESLASLSTKDKWIWAPSRNIFKRVTIRLRETFDSSSTPEVGEHIKEPKSLAEVDLEGLKKKIASTIERAKQEDPRELRKQIAELRKQLQGRPVQAEVKTVERVVERPVLKDGQLIRLEKIAQSLKSTAEGIISITEGIGKDKGPKAQNPTQSTIANPKIDGMRRSSAVERRFVKSDVGGSIPSAAAIQEEITLRKGERRMLGVLCRWYPAKLTKAQLATLSRLRVTSGTFSAYYGTLKRAGLIYEHSDGGVQVSESGLDRNEIYLPNPQTTGEILTMWRNSLRAGERRLLDILVEIYPQSISREELSDRTNLTANAGTFSAYLGTLRRNGLAEVNGGQVRAGEALFLSQMK